nr:SCP2 sterol-binding domain-containing protein [Chloroflexota bacterium]
MTLTVAAADYLSLINGDASPMALFMAGKVNVRGDMQLALKLQTLFNMPS